MGGVEGSSPSHLWESESETYEGVAGQRPFLPLAAQQAQGCEGGRPPLGHPNRCRVLGRPCPPIS